MAAAPNPNDLRRRAICRFQMPFSCVCSSCGTSIARGTKFNCTKEPLPAEYLGIKSWRFRANCRVCSAGFAVKTDPQSQSYICDSGLVRIARPSDAHASPSASADPRTPPVASSRAAPNSVVLQLSDTDLRHLVSLVKNHIEDVNSSDTTSPKTPLVVDTDAAVHVHDFDTTTLTAPWHDVVVCRTHRPSSLELPWNSADYAWKACHRAVTGPNGTSGLVKLIVCSICGRSFLPVQRFRWFDMCACAVCSRAF